MRKRKTYNFFFLIQVRSGNCGNFWNVKSKNKEERINPVSPKWEAVTTKAVTL